MTNDPDHTWRRIESELRQRVPPDMYEIWLAPLRLVEIAGDQVVVEAPRELRAWVAERFARVLQASAVAVLGPSAVAPFLLAHPPVMFRMLQAQARRLRNANRWRS